MSRRLVGHQPPAFPNVSRRGYYARVSGLRIHRYQSAFSGEWVSTLWDYPLPDNPYTLPCGQRSTAIKPPSIHALAHYVRNGR